MVNATPRPLYPRERPGTHCIEGWVGPKAVWKGAENLAPTGIRLARRLRYGGAHLPLYAFMTCMGTSLLNRLTPNDPYMGRTAPLSSKHCILYIYSTNTDTEYFKHALYSPFFFSLQNAVCFIMLTCLVPVLFTFYIQGVLKLKKNTDRFTRTG